MTELVLPGQTEGIFRKMSGGWHPALLLDKYTAPPREKSGGGQKEALEKILRAGQASDLLNAALDRQSWSFTNASVLNLETAGPLTIHLSRPNALENAGLAFHPVYGFVYLPGSGLKGMTRAWAEQVVKADEADIERIFGHVAGSKGAAGAVIFHDALPTVWPKLRLEIATSHHRDYYAGKAKAAPGDWESPNPVVFLAVTPGASFRFALSPARGDTEAVAIALAWLQAALCHAGAGAKTASGYGRFTVKNPAPVPASLATRDVRLELVTPAFLAGPSQSKDDCDLSVGTLRGQLRWWWRMLHSAHVPLEELRRLEMLVWGGLSGFAGKEGRGSAIALHLTRKDAHAAVLFDKDDEVTRHNIPRLRDKKTIMGLHYGAYGMDETDSKTKLHKQRHYLPEKTSWRVQISARAAGGIGGELILSQALAALWLLCRYGGVGSKSRKGWGSFADLSLPDLPDLESCKKAAAAFREAAKARPGEVPDAMAIGEMIAAEHAFPNEGDPWRVLNQAGTLLQTFAKGLSPKENRRALGLPRLIGGKSGTKLTGPKGDRHASPAHFHVARAGKGFVLRLAAFPAARLPDEKTSKDVLGKLAKSVEQAERVTSTAAMGQTGPAPRSAPPARPKSALLPEIGSPQSYNGEAVRVVEHEPPEKVVIQFDDGESESVLASSLQPLPK